jgi:hypothetical protein
MASGFARAPGSVLRREAALFELERPMGIHKASLVCLPQGRIATEFAEPPNAGERELGRLTAFADLLERFDGWYELASFQTRSKRDAGVWVLEIHARPKPRADAAAARDWAFSALLTLFDMSYDCSGLPTEQGSLRGRLTDPGWRGFFAALIAYRADLRDQPGHLASRCDPLPVFLLALLRSRAHEAWLAERWGESTGQALARLEELVRPTPPLGLDAWQRRLAGVQGLSLQLAARDPAALLAWLDGCGEADPALFPIGRAVLGRASLTPRIGPLLARCDRRGLTPFQRLCLHVRPDLFLRFGDVARARALLRANPARHGAAGALLARSPSAVTGAPPDREGAP